MSKVLNTNGSITYTRYRSNYKIKFRKGYGTRECQQKRTNIYIDIDIDILQIFTSLEAAHTTHTKPLKAELKNNLN